MAWFDIDFAALGRALAAIFGGGEKPPQPPKVRYVRLGVNVDGRQIGEHELINLHGLLQIDGESLSYPGKWDGRFTFAIPGATPAPFGATVIVTADDYRQVSGGRFEIKPLDLKTQANVNQDIVNIEMTSTARQRFSRNQIVDIQTDLMLWCPELAPTFVDNMDAELSMRFQGHEGQQAHGIAAGWLWTPWIVHYPPHKRQIAYAKAKSIGWTHWTLHIPQMGPNEGYHGVLPFSQEMSDTYGERLNTAHRELLAAGLIPLCAGLAPGLEPAHGFIREQALVAFDDFDNSAEKASRVKVMHEALPNALIFVEMPADDIYPAPSADDPVPINPQAGGSWIRAMRQRYPRFIGVIHEAQIGASVDETVSLYTRKHAWWHDLPENLGEFKTYEQFWRNFSVDDLRRDADAVATRCPWLKGTLSGWTMRPQPQYEGDDAEVKPATGDQIDPSTISAVGGKPFLTWPATARITKLALTNTGVYVEFTTKDTWPDVTPPRWDGPVRYSLGVVLNIRGRWLAGAPVECWWKDSYYEFGGSIQDRNADNSGRGQIALNWFYDHNIPPLYRWDDMAGYQPDEGEEFGFFVVAGSVRNSVYAAFERSAIVKITMPPSGQAKTFEWR